MEAVKRPYIVTVKEHAHLEEIYNELETAGVSPSTTTITRSVECIERRPISRNTVYELTDEEAEELRNDPRIVAVELPPKLRGIEPRSLTRLYSEKWDRGANEPEILSITGRRNWGKLRIHQETGISNWGDYNDTNTYFQTSLIDKPYTGKNVDVVVVDSLGIIYDHPEYAVNEDGTGGSRFIPYNWYQHNPVVANTAANNYPYPPSANADYHATHVAGTVVGHHHGIATRANLYHIGYDTPFGAIDFGEYVFDYIREFHRNKPINPETGRKNPTVVNNSWGYFINNFIGNFALSSIVVDNRVILPNNGLNGVYNERERIAFFANQSLANSTHVITTSSTIVNTTAEATTPVSNLTYQANGIAPTVASPVSFAPGIGYYFRIQLPSPVYFRGVPYTFVGIAAQGGLLFGDINNIPLYQDDATVLRSWTLFCPKIMVTAVPLNTSTGARVMVQHDQQNNLFTIKVESTNNNSSFNTVYEFVLDINPNNTPSTPVSIKLNIGVNAKSGGIFDNTSKAELILTRRGGQWSAPGARVPSIDADVEDAIAEGIIFVGAAGNQSYSLALEGTPAWNNSLTTTGGQTFYTNRGSTPTASGFGVNNITVGAIGVPRSYLANAYAAAITPSSAVKDLKASFSDTGPGVDLYAPGLNIISSFPNNQQVAFPTQDERNPAYYIAKLNGSSMAAPHVTGVVACMLEQNPNLNQDQVKQILIDTSIKGEMYDGSYGETWWYGIRNGNNRILRYNTAPRGQGLEYPESDAAVRNTSQGQLYPRQSTITFKTVS